jgi:hypothetical protein
MEARQLNIERLHKQGCFISLDGFAYTHKALLILSWSLTTLKSSVFS